MSDDNIENLPSINDFLKEEKSEELPSVDNFIEKKEEIIEEKQLEEPIVEATSIGDLTEILRLISDVRKDIPNISEIKTYDEELRILSEEIVEIRGSIPEVPEPKNYDREVEVICEQIDLVKQHIADLPEVKYYDEQLSDLDDRIDILKEQIPEVPESKSYDAEIAAICEQIDKVKAEIPNLPEWVNEDSLPDLSWVGRTFSVINEDVTKVNDALHTVRDRLKCDVEQLTETISTKEFETGVEIEGVRENIKETKEEIRKNVENITDKIYDELKEAALQITSHHREFKDDDNKLKKYILGKYEVLKQNVNEQINEFNDKNVESQNIITGSLKEYFDTLKKEIAELPDATYYAESIESLKGDVSYLKENRKEQGLNITELYKLVKELKDTQQILKEDLTDNPPTYTEINQDPLTPLDQKFATLKDLSDHYRLFVNRIQTQIASIGGGGAVNLQYLDDISGIATNLSAYEGMFLKVDTSQTGIDAHKKFKFASVTSGGGGEAPNVFYVAKNGDDSNDGTTIGNAKLTIAGAVGIATSGSTIKVLSGTYVEANPIEVPAFVAIKGDDQRSVNVSGNESHKDIFSVRKGVKLSNMTFQNHVAPAAAVGFPTGEIAENVGGGKWKGPYIQNCTSNTTTGTGIRIDGNQARLLKAMNVDAFTQYNQGGVGVAVTNGGFAQLVSLFTICCNEGVTCDKGGQADIANSNSSFGTYGLVSRGVGPLQYTGVVTSSAAAAQDNVVLNISSTEYNISGVAYTHTTGEATITTSAAHDFQVGMGVTIAGMVMSCTYGTKTYPYRRPYVFKVESLPDTDKFTVNLGISTLAHTYSSGGTVSIDKDRPYDGQVVYFDTLYNSVNTITVGSGGTGYTSTPSVTVDAPAGPNGETATAYATVENEMIASITIISNGSQYETTPTVTIGAPNVGINTATATAAMAPIYYTINSSTPVTAGITTLTLEENLINTVGVASTAFFHQVSKIIASSHTFEYIGSGNEIANATPKRGGTTNQANEVVTESGGKVLYTSTDQSGNFRIGDDLQINQNTGTISGKSFSKSLFSEITPFILALS